MATSAHIRREQATRLQAARAAAGFEKPTDAVKKFEWPQSTYLAHENGQNGISPGHAITYAKKYGVEPGWILTGVGRGPKRAAGGNAVEAPIGDDFVPIGRFDASFSMGPGALLADNPQPMGYWMVEAQWLKALTRGAPDMLAIVKATGDSMVPTLLSDDWVLIDKAQRRLTREGIYAIRVGDDVWIKRISLNLKTKMVRVVSDNQTTPPQPDLEEGELEIIGRVIAIVARKM